MRSITALFNYQALKIRAMIRLQVDSHLSLFNYVYVVKELGVNLHIYSHYVQIIYDTRLKLQMETLANITSYV